MHFEVVDIWLVWGRSSPEIAGAFNVSRLIAMHHINQRFTRLDAHDRGEALQRHLTAKQAT